MDRLYWRPPSAETLASTPWYKAEDFPPPPDVEVWDELLDVIFLFQQYDTQWRMGPGGPIGLDMSVFHHALDRKGIADDEYDEYIANLGIIESQALMNLHKK